MNIVETGYLDTIYLQGYGYLSGQIQAGLGMQVTRAIKKNKITGQQVALRIIDDLDDPHIGSQAEMYVDEQIGDGFQVSQKIIDDQDDPHVGMQTEFIFVDVYGSASQQAQMQWVDKRFPIGAQVEMTPRDKLKATSFQVEMGYLDSLRSVGMQAKIFPLAHWQCPRYLLTENYLDTSYLAGCFRAFQGMQVYQQILESKVTGQQTLLKIIDDQDDPHVGQQVKMVVKKEDPIGLQTRMHIISEADDPHVGQQVLMKIDTEKVTSLQVLMRIVDQENPLGIQINMLAARKNSSQVTMVIYNITQLRILCDFISRGVPALGGTNWTSIQPIEVGDFSPNNLNTDVIEQRTQTQTGITALWELRCDTGIPQGGFVDTIAILDHNFTRSARVTFQGTNDPTWGTVGLSLVMVTEPVNMYYISPALPTESFRYNRFIIEDSTNTDDYLRIGVIIFGSSNIFTMRECFANPVIFGTRHYKDTIETEGFTNVSNDRAIRKFLTLEFDSLKYDGGNFAFLRNYFNHAKTDLKCLIIPRPTRPSSLAVFSKLTQLPEESHNAIADDSHYVSLTLNWDESL